MRSLLVFLLFAQSGRQQLASLARHRNPAGRASALPACRRRCARGRGGARRTPGRRCGAAAGPFGSGFLRMAREASGTGSVLLPWSHLLQSITRRCGGGRHLAPSRHGASKPRLDLAPCLHSICGLQALRLDDTWRPLAEAMADFEERALQLQVGPCAAFDRTGMRVGCCWAAGSTGMGCRVWGVGAVPTLRRLPA